MELYTITRFVHRREAIIEHFESFIWTERYNAYGDFQLVAEPSPENRSRLKVGTLLGFDQSNTFMVIDTVEKVEDAEGKLSLKIEGKAGEYIFENRIAKKEWPVSDWIITGTPGGIISEMVSTICVNGGGISTYDWFDIIVRDSTVQTDIYSIAIKPETLYTRIKEVSDMFNLGFRMLHENGTVNSYVFEIFEGIDLTHPNGVVFSEEYDNLANDTFLKSNRGHRNVAYVQSKHGHVITDIHGVLDPVVTGFDRRVIYVDANDIDEGPGQNLEQLLIGRGREELTRRYNVSLYDGVIDPQGIFKYNLDYSLGDIVLFKGEGEEKQDMRVVEYIHTYDQEGYRAYPTFSPIVYI